MTPWWVMKDLRNTQLSFLIGGSPRALGTHCFA